jgi:hypothetical protein
MSRRARGFLRQLRRLHRAPTVIIRVSSTQGFRVGMKVIVDGDARRSLRVVAITAGSLVVQ